MKFLIDLWMDGYNSEEEMKEACIVYIKDQLDSSATSIKVLNYDDEITKYVSERDEARRLADKYYMYANSGTFPSWQDEGLSWIKEED